MTDSGAFVLKTRTVRVECDLKDGDTEELAYPGLWAEVRRNLTNGERMELRERADEIDERADRLITGHTEKQAAYETALKAVEGDADELERLTRSRITEINQYVAASEVIGIERFDLIAPHIHRWNLNTIGDDGEYVPIPPPREAGTAVLAELEMPIVGWLMAATMQAYRLGFPIGSRKSGEPVQPTPAPNAESRMAKGSRSRRSPAKSSLPVA